MSTIWVINEDLEYNKEGKPIIAFTDKEDAERHISLLRAKSFMPDYHLFEVPLEQPTPNREQK